MADAIKVIARIAIEGKEIEVSTDELRRLYYTLKPFFEPTPFEFSKYQPKQPDRWYVPAVSTAAPKVFT